MKYRRWLLILLFAAFFLRMGNLGGKSFWLDEAYSVVQGKPTLTRVDANNPPLYYTGLYYWSAAFGRAEAIARLPSVLFSLLNVALLYRLARQLFAGREGARIALLAAALLAFSPLNLWYAQEARMYTLLVSVALLMAVGSSRRHWSGFLLYFVGLSVGLYVGYLVFPLWVAISILGFVLWRQRGQGLLWPVLWLLTSVAAWALYRPWWPEFEAWLQTSLLNHWMFNPVRSLLGVAQLATWHFLVALLLAAVLLGVGAALAPRLLRRAGLRRWITAAVVAGFVLWLLLVPVPRLYGLKRLSVSGWPFVILFVAWLAAHAGRRRELLARALLALSLAASLSTFLAPKDDWRAVSRLLAQRQVAHETLWVDPRWNQIPLRYYGHEVAVPGGQQAELEALAAGSDELWLVAERFHGRPAPSSPSEAWLDRNWRLEEAIPFYRLEVRRYRSGP